MSDDMISRADAIAAINDASGTDLCSCSHCRSGYNTAIAKISAMPAVEVGVRELEWEQVSPRICEGVGYNCIYQIRVGTDGRVRWQGRYMGKWEDADSVEAAKAAAQADYAARIRSALTTTPAQDVVEIDLRAQLAEADARADRAEAECAARMVNEAKLGFYAIQCLHRDKPQLVTLDQFMDAILRDARAAGDGK